MIKGALRSAYNASGRSLGTKDSKGVIKERICAPVIISGEELPEDDEALLSRLIVVHLKLLDRNDSYYNDVFNLSQEAGKHIYKLIIEKTEESTSKIMEDIKKLGINRVVVAACSPRLHEETFRGALREAGLNPHLLQIAPPGTSTAIIKDW
jgi:hypothetical protein